MQELTKHFLLQRLLEVSMAFHIMSMMYPEKDVSEVQYYKEYCIPRMKWNSDLWLTMQPHFFNWLETISLNMVILLSLKEIFVFKQFLRSSNMTSV